MKTMKKTWALVHLFFLMPLRWENSICLMPSMLTNSMEKRREEKSPLELYSCENFVVISIIVHISRWKIYKQRCDMLFSYKLTIKWNFHFLLVRCRRRRVFIFLRWCLLFFFRISFIWEHVKVYSNISQRIYSCDVVQCLFCSSSLQRFTSKDVI